MIEIGFLPLAAPTARDAVGLTVITNNETLIGAHNGSVRVDGCEYVIAGTLNGSLRVSKGGVVRVKGAHNGTLSVDEGGQIIVTGRANGSTTIYPGANFVVEPLGRLSGSTSNNGTLIIAGAFGGAYRGHGVRILAGDGDIKKPVMRNGIRIYE